MRIKLLIRELNLLNVVDGISYYTVEAGDLRYPREAVEANEKEFRALVQEWKKSGKYRSGDIKDFENIILAVSEWNKMYFEELDKLLRESVQQDIDMDCLANYELK